MANEDPLRPRPETGSDARTRADGGDPASRDDRRTDDAEGGAVSPGASPAADAARAGDVGASEIDRLRGELAALKDRVLRDQAELENFKKRAVRDKTEALRYANEGLLRALLPVMDNLQRAIDHARSSREVEPIIEGVELVLRSFGDVLERHDVKVVDAHGTPFDPSRHEAIGHVQSTEPANTVVAQHQRGYTLHDRLLRPALVTVGKGPAPDEAAGSREPTRH